MENVDVYKLLEMVLTFAIPLLTLFFGAKFAIFRKKLVQIANLVAKAQLAAEDGKLEEAELRDIGEAVLAILGKEISRQKTKLSG